MVHTFEDFEQHQWHHSGSSLALQELRAHGHHLAESVPGRLERCLEGGRWRLGDFFKRFSQLLQVSPDRLFAESYTKVPVVPHKVVAEVSKIANL